jgi:uncharacterized membrane protein
MLQINKELIKTNSELRQFSREALKGNWGSAILLCIIFSVIGALSGFIPYVGAIIIGGPLTLGFTICFLNLIRREPFRLESLFDGFKRFVPAMLLYVLQSLFIVLWTLLLIIPGIIATFRYSMAYFILNDNIEMTAKEALKASKEMMKGYKWKLFSLYLSFTGWILLSILTLGIGFLWVGPYMYAATASFYENLKEASLDDMITSQLLDENISLS